ncbi:Proton channel OTOP1 [Halotydeus destructor]|nr:Proton channel OTOP1 [Halotydeus destructor]
MVLQVNIDSANQEYILLEGSCSAPSTPSCPVSASSAGSASFFEVRVEPSLTLHGNGHHGNNQANNQVNNYGNRFPTSSSTSSFKAAGRVGRKKSATIYEADREVDDEVLMSHNVGHGVVGHSVVGHSVDRDDESTRSSQLSAGPPPQYFELNQLNQAANLVVGGNGHSSSSAQFRRKAFRRQDSCVSSVSRYQRDNTSDEDHKAWKMSDALDSLTFVLSALYAKLLIIIGLCFPMAEVISHRIPIGWYEGFYLYLYLGSIFFLAFVYLSRLASKSSSGGPSHLARLRAIFCWTNLVPPSSPPLGKPKFQVSSTESSINEEPAIVVGNNVHFGSFYLRLGAVAFGIGSMIYSGLEFGQFFELESKEHCYSFLYGFTPSSHMAFTFFQLYFIFMNSTVFIQKHHLLARFGLMHMIGTNMCVWLHVLIQETKHQITILVNPNASASELMPSLAIPWSKMDDVVSDLSEDYLDTLTPYEEATEVHKIVTRSIDDHHLYTTHGQCRRSNVIGQLVQDASQFLFPCTIEYSLICAAILYMMWKYTGTENASSQRLRHRSAASTSTVNYHLHHKHQYQVDCAKAHKGLFCGIFLLVVCIISLILFFVLIKKPNYRHIGVFQAHIVELIVYVINAIACLIAVLQIQELRYSRHRNVELDNILLIVAQSGLYIFNMFSMIGAQFFSTTKNTQLVLINAIACLLQATFQTAFILDASRRYCHTPEQARKKPGREMVTFMLVCNFAMWLINTLETRRADSNPVQMHFYGFWAWTIITHVTTPLTIFYRFHSTVCLCDIWKRVYKLRGEF